MDEERLKSRAILFALGAGAVAFLVALVARSAGELIPALLCAGLIPAVLCAGLCWAAVRRSGAANGAAIDAVIARLTSAADGDLTGAIPSDIAMRFPRLATAMHGLFDQLNANLDRAHRLALFDPVTGLANRTNFRRTCERMLADAAPGSGGALLFIDLDRFKAVNDTLGHASGDMLLGMVAARLRTVANSIPTLPGGAPPLIGRLSGDEFTMFFTTLSDPGAAARVGRGILLALAEPFDLDGTAVTIGASIGIALRPQHGETMSELMRAADAAMYHAKASGRGRAEPFSAELAARIADRVVLESDLHDAIDRDEFTLVFQPQVGVDHGRIVAAEALIRWSHPRDGLRLPGTFLDRAEETGLIVEIGDWVVQTVAATIARWGRMGVEQRLAINISPRQLEHATFFHRLRDAMRAADAPARLLELEISETLVMQCSDVVIAAIALLRADGATIAIDDFGTGYSNLARLRRLPIDRIKLDRSLIAPIADDTEARTIAHAVIGLIHGLGCEAVGEGVETHAQAEILRIIGCDVIQGYAVAAPMDEAAFLAWSKAVTVRAAVR